MSISSEITRISNAKTAISESIANKGVTVPSGTKIDGMATLIDSIQTGGAAVQPSKALTVTSNGTTTITPDAPYDAIKQVDLTVNVGDAEAANVVILANAAIHIMYYDGLSKIPRVEFFNVGSWDIITLKNSIVGVSLGEYGYIDIIDDVGCSHIISEDCATVLITDSMASFRVHNRNS